ncbi:MAG: type II toxin-antitoxin system RelE/ParE family toxin [Acetobacteraceae bacterium]
MIYSAEAERQIDDFRRHYRAKGRVEAAQNLLAALAKAEARIENEPAAGLPAPRPFPTLRRDGRAWIKTGRYWIVYSVTRPPVVLGVFYDAADIPNRA